MLAWSDINYCVKAGSRKYTRLAAMFVNTDSSSNINLSGGFINIHKIVLSHYVALDNLLQLIIVDSMNLSMFGNIATYGSAKKLRYYVRA